MSNNLSRIEVAAAQTQKEVTINNSDGVLDAAITKTGAIAVTSSNAYTLSTTEWTQNFTFTVDEDGGDPADDAITLTVPATERGVFQVVNETAYTVTVTVSGQSETPPTVAAGDTVILTCDGADVRQPAAGGAGSFLDLSDTPSAYTDSSGMVPVVNGTPDALVFRARAYDFGFTFGSEPSTSTVIQRVQISRAITIPADMSGSTGTVATNPTSSYVVDVQDDSVSIGTITISTGGSFTFATTSGIAKNVAAGSVITFTSPAGADGTVAGVAVGILATEDFV